MPFRLERVHVKSTGELARAPSCSCYSRDVLTYPLHPCATPSASINRDPCRDVDTLSLHASSTAGDVAEVPEQQAKLHAAASLKSWEHAGQLELDIRRSSLAPPQAQVTGLERQLTLLLVRPPAVVRSSCLQGCKPSPGSPASLL